MSHKIIVEHETVHSGQLRAYGDSIYEGYITFSVPEGQMVGSKFMHDERSIGSVKSYVKLMACGFVEGEEIRKNPFSPALKFLRQVSPGRWHYRIERMYLD